MIAIIDYGMGNIHSVQKALEKQGAKVIVTNNPEEIEKADKLVLPGVGAFDDAVAELEKQDLIPAIKESIKNKKPFLGICLGMQLLFEASEEAKTKKGLGILKGTVKKFKASKGLKVPHMGWNQLKRSTVYGLQSTVCHLLKDIPEGANVYFCHSYYPEPKDKKVIAATCNYNSDFAAVVCQDNVYGAQFHPEKSQDVGLIMLKNFIERC
ncbi:MAG: imidazole glycerol phosphate synthase subunit HisH [Candidatus Omnitrophota bacterium]